MRNLVKGKELPGPLTAWCDRCLAYVPQIGWHTCADSVLKQGPQTLRKRR